MKKALIIIGVVLVVTGIIIVSVYGGVTGLRGLAHNTFKHDLTLADETKTVSLDGPALGLEIRSDSYSVYVRPSENENVVLKYISDLPHGVVVNFSNNDGVIALTEMDDNNIQGYNGWLGGLRSSKRFLVVEVPQEKFATAYISVTMRAGCVRISNLSFGDFNCKVDAGLVELTSCQAALATVLNNAGTVTLKEFEASNLSVNLNSGAVDASDVVVTDSIDITVDAGGIKCEAEATQMTLKNNAGGIEFDVKAVVLVIKVDVGSVEGNIEGNADDFCITVKKGLGTSNISSNNKVGAPNTLSVEVETGSINVNFH